MLLTYSYKQRIYKIGIQWTVDTGQSTVFRDIVKKIANRHRIDIGDFYDIAGGMDDLTDKLYEQIYIFIDEYSGVPYNPRFRRAVLLALAEITGSIERCCMASGSDHKRLLSDLFADVADKLHKMVGIYLDDNAYQGKHRYRRVNKEQPYETTDENLLGYCFEDALVQMMDTSRLLDCLTDTQRRRLVKHIFLKYTFQEIADHEHISWQSVQGSIVAALKKIRQRLI